MNSTVVHTNNAYIMIYVWSEQLEIQYILKSSIGIE